MNGSMTAKKLRIVLAATMLLCIVALIGGFLAARHSLLGYATSISQLNADASSGDQGIATLSSIEKRLEQETATISAAQSIVTDNSSFAEKVVGDVTRIAAQSGVTISSLEYVDSGTPGSATPATPATPTTTPAPTTATPAPAGVTTKSISVTLESPMKYANLMKFITGIENNNLKLQIASVSLTKDAGDMVETQTFSIGANVR